jgi:Domain of unknown function (DU1801)
MKLRSRTTATQSKGTSNCSAVAERTERRFHQESEPKKKARTTPQTSKYDEAQKEERTTVGSTDSASGGGGAIATPEDYINAITDANRRLEIQELHNLIRQHAPSLEPTTEFKDKLGYGKYHYQYKSGRQGDWVKIGLALYEKSNSISLHFCGLGKDGKYVLEGFTKPRLANKTGTTKSKGGGGGGGIISLGKSCLRFHSVQDLDETALIELIKATETADVMT